jgi:hypothetical protein
MLGASLLAVAAVLADDRLVFVETTAGVVLRQVVLPGTPVRLFAAPDGRVLLPLAGSDETVVVSPTGPTERWTGRLFPLFFDEVDRMHVVFPELLLVMSYPERLPILRVPVPGVRAAWRAATTGNGLVVVVCPPRSERRVVIVTAEPGSPQREIALAGEPRLLAIAPDAAWVAVGYEDAVEVAFSAEPHGRGRIPMRGAVRDLAASADGAELLVALDGTAAALAELRLSAKHDAGAKVRGELALDGGVASLAAGGDTVAAVARDRLLVLSKRGTKVVREIPVAGASQVVLLPARPESAVPLWSTP